jgi:hypothetical protein
MLKLYDFKCPACNTVTERLVRGDEEVKCSCGVTLLRMPSAPSTNFSFADARYSSPKFRKK